MQTPSEPAKQWEARPRGEKRSIFGNYRAGGEADAILPDEVFAAPSDTPLPASVDEPMARAFLHHFLSCAFADPNAQAWQWMSSDDVRLAFRSAAALLAESKIEAAAGVLMRELTPGALEPFLDDYVATFGHAARGSVPMNEIEYGDLKADPLFQPHRLADLAAFYRAFGLEMDDAAAERHDHLCIELEFMSVLAAKEAYAIAVDHEGIDIIRDAQKNFLREHLGRWALAFGRRLRSAATSEFLMALGDFLRAFVEVECARFSVRPGSEDLLLRPVDEESERLCDSCGIHNLPPGATGAAPGN